MQLRTVLAACAAQLLALPAFTAADFETPADESPSTSLTAAQVTGENFHVVDPVRSDGLMHHYVIDSKYGILQGYGHDAVLVRLQEVAALNTLAHTPKTDVILKSIIRAATPDAPSLILLATHPTGTIIGIPVGVAHLLVGVAAEAKEAAHSAKEATKPDAKADTSGGDAPKAEPKSDEGSDATRFAQRYLGVTDAERRWFKKLGVDPYPDNAKLREAVHRIAKLDAGASLPLRFAGIPRLPYGSQFDRAMDSIYNENPAVLRERRRGELKSYGMTAAEINRFEHTLLLNPTRQNVLAEIAKSLEGVNGRAELFRHAMTVTSVEEIQVFLHSAALLPALHKQRPLAQILPGLRIPAAQLADGRVLLVGSFDAVYWTQDVAGYESALRQALPPKAPREVWVSGAISARAKTELAQRGWEVHDQAAKLLSAPGAS